MTNRTLPYVGELRPAFLAHAANRLDTLICAQTESMLADAGAATPARSVSAMIYLNRRGPASSADIAAADGQSHQLVSSRIAPLEELGLIARGVDPNDRRRKLLKLTAKGKSDAKIVEGVCKTIARAMESLQGEMGVDLFAAIEEAERNLTRRTISERAAGPALAARNLTMRKGTANG